MDLRASALATGRVLVEQYEITRDRALSSDETINLFQTEFLGLLRQISADGDLCEVLSTQVDSNLPLAFIRHMQAGETLEVSSFIRGGSPDDVERLEQSQLTLLLLRSFMDRTSYAKLLTGHLTDDPGKRPNYFERHELEGFVARHVKAGLAPEEIALLVKLQILKNTYRDDPAGWGDLLYNNAIYAMLFSRATDDFGGGGSTIEYVREFQMMGPDTYISANEKILDYLIQARGNGSFEQMLVWGRSVKYGTLPYDESLLRPLYEHTGGYRDAVQKYLKGELTKDSWAEAYGRYYRLCDHLEHLLKVADEEDSQEK
ncbi:MAG: hypothetical protein AAB538_00870 [Patescibacteria group bacterium]